MQDDKRRHRELKRDLKRAGNRKRRQFLKKDLARNPDEAPHTEFEFGRATSAGLNGNDHDATRRRGPEESADASEEE